MQMTPELLAVSILNIISMALVAVMQNVGLSTVHKDVVAIMVLCLLGIVQALESLIGS
jgi:hypothetical protein